MFPRKTLKIWEFLSHIWWLKLKHFITLLEYILLPKQGKRETNTGVLRSDRVMDIWHDQILVIYVDGGECLRQHRHVSRFPDILRPRGFPHPEPVMSRSPGRPLVTDVSPILFTHARTINYVYWTSPGTCGFHRLQTSEEGQVPYIVYHLSLGDRKMSHLATCTLIVLSVLLQFQYKQHMVLRRCNDEGWVSRVKTIVDIFWQICTMFSVSQFTMDHDCPKRLRFLPVPKLFL